MKLITLLAFLVASIWSSFGQHKIKITLNGNNSKIAFFDKDGNSIGEYSRLNILDGAGKIEIANEADSKTYSVLFKNAQGETFTLPSSEMPDKGASKIYTLDKSGVLNPAPGGVASTYFKGMKIELKGEAGMTKEIEELKTPDSDKGSNDNPQKSLYAYVEKRINKLGLFYNRAQNLLIDQNNVIHIYLDENMNPIYTYFPTTAKENTDKFQFHILSREQFKYSISSAGEFNPTTIAEDIPTGGFAKVQSRGDKEEDIYEFTSPIFGIYTGSFPFEIQKLNRESSEKVGKPFAREINLLKVHRVSLNIGVVNSWLKNPENITTFIKPNGDTTLIADNPTTRQFLTGFLTFHLIPRNINIPPRNWKERLGLSFGTSIRGNFASDWFFGLNIELATGLFVNGGVHLGSINFPIEQKKNFNYGTDKFSGELITKKRTDTAPYLSVVVDAALFLKAFRNLLSSGGADQ